jgi:hypothetical protein
VKRLVRIAAEDEWKRTKPDERRPLPDLRQRRIKSAPAARLLPSCASLNRGRGRVERQEPPTRDEAWNKQLRPGVLSSAAASEALQLRRAQEAQKSGLAARSLMINGSNRPEPLHDASDRAGNPGESGKEASAKRKLVAKEERKPISC